MTLPNPVKSGYTFDGWYSDSAKTSKITGPTHTITADSTIYAKWDTATFTILYEYNGRDGGDSTVSDTYTTEATGITLPVPTRTGYNFGGWFETSDFASGTEATSAYTTTANRTLYAKWNAIDYTVTYDVNGGTGTVPTDSNNYNYLDDVPVAGPGAISRTGYNFTGWTVASNGSGTVLNSGDTFEMGTSNVTLYAKWAGKTYNVTYNTNGATGSPARTSDTYTVDQSSAIVAPGVGTMQKLGYTFTGWSASATGTGSTANITPTADTQLYAIWVLKTINISYSSGTIDAGILSTMPSDVTGTKKYGETFTLDSLIDDPVSSGGSSFKFFGWKDGSNTVYEKGETVILGANDYTFTAQWAETFAVRYALNGGTGVALYDSECLETGNKCTAVQDPITLSNAPSRDGYTFTGWLDSAGNTHAAGASLKIDSNNYLLYAQWTAIDYTLSFDEAGGSTTRSDIVGNISENKQLPAAPGSKTGYSFLGWSDGSVVYGGQTVFTIGSADVDFTAVWEPDVYTVSYDWRGGAGSPQADDSYTVGTGTLSLPSQGDRTRDGFVFGGWSETADGSALSAFTPTSDTTLYAVWNNGNYALTFDLNGGTGVPTSALVPRTESRVFPEPTREGFVLAGWFDSDSGGNKLGDAGDSFTPTSSKTYHAQWVQRSLFGVDLATLNGSYSSTLTADESNPNPISSSLDDGTTKATVSVPQGSLPTGTKINVQYFRDTARQSTLIPGENNYFFSVLVSWLLGTGDTATVPDTDPSIPIVVTLENSQIKAGARIYQVIGTQVTDLGVATVDGEVTVQLYEDPEIVVASTKPAAPTAVTATAGDQQATVSWTAPSDNGGEAITGYTVTSTPGSLTCTTATTSCVVSGLTNSTAYTFTVTATNSVGTSDASTASNSVTPATTIYTVTFNSNGGSSVASQTFPDGDPLTAPANPTKSGYNFAGWSTVLDDADTKIDFNSPPNVTSNLVLYALWTAVVSGGSGGSGGGGISGSGDANPEVSVIPNAIPGGQTSFTLPAGGQGTAASIEGFELPISMTANGVTLEIPSDVPAGTYDLTLTIDGTEYVYLSALTVVSEEEFGAMTYWTKRISQTEVKVYIKNPELGAKYRILHQTGGSGSYETIFVKTIESTTDSSLRFNSQGRYIVRTIDLSEINRIRIRIDDDEVWKVRYNNYSDTPFITTSTNPLVSLWGRVVRLFS